MAEAKMRLVQLADEIIIAAEFLEVADSGAACTQSVSFFFSPPGGPMFFDQQHRRP
jgi:hypothetical protein